MAFLDWRGRAARLTHQSLSGLGVGGLLPDASRVVFTNQLSNSLQLSAAACQGEMKTLLTADEKYGKYGKHSTLKLLRLFFFDLKISRLTSVPNLRQLDSSWNATVAILHLLPLTANVWRKVLIAVRATMMLWSEGNNEVTVMSQIGISGISRLPGSASNCAAASWADAST